MENFLCPSNTYEPGFPSDLHGAWGLEKGVLRQQVLVHGLQTCGGPGIFTALNWTQGPAS